MKKQDDILIEILTEELPPKSLRKLAEAFLIQVETRLQKNNFKYTNAYYYATPRRLAVLFEQTDGQQPDQLIERKGPALKTAFDATGKPTKACEGFARSCGVEVKDLIRIKSAQGEWLGYKQHVVGKTLTTFLPSMLEEAAAALPAKYMRWGNGSVQFIRPIHKIILLYGDELISTQVLGVESGRITLGHRFMVPHAIIIPHASAYESILATEGWVIANFNKRRQSISEKARICVQSLSVHAFPQMHETLLDEVTGLVEWPVILLGKFDEQFLELPQEVLVSAMQAHQRYFPIWNKHTQKLLPNFVIISNLQSKDESQVIHGNERVLRARLSDAAFFYQHDKEERLNDRLERLQGVIFHAKLGTLYDKAERLAHLTVSIAKMLNVNIEDAKRAGWLAKTDLTTHMVNEFPELQGVIGEYYARNDGESDEVAISLHEQYLPRFSGDSLPDTPLGQALAMADRIDLLTGVFGVGEIPSGDKDPFALRRAAVGVLRILIEKKLPLDLNDVLEAAISNYKIKLSQSNLKQLILDFIRDRLRAWYLEHGVSADIFASVSALDITVPFDMDERIKAVQTFKKLKEADTLSVANKRVSNILTKYEEKIVAKEIEPAFFESEFERVLAAQLEVKSNTLRGLGQCGKYAEALLVLAELREPIDDFFDNVMVMADDKTLRENRLLLLSKLRALFLQVADIALLQ